MDSHGARLKKLRLEKGLSLEEAQKKTRINLNILKAIEGDSVSNLSPIYLKSFIKIYCEYLGVDYKDYISQEKPVPTPAPQVAAVKEVLSGTDPAKNNSILNSRPIKLGGSGPGRKIKFAVILIVSFALLSLALFALGRLISSRKSAPSVKAPQKQAAKSSQPKKDAKKPAQPKVQSQPAVVKPVEIPLKPRKDLLSEIRLVIRSKENCFVHLKVDGKVVFHQELARGRSEIWTGKNRMELSIGNAGVVELEVNGQIFSKLGRRGESIKGILITREGLTIPR